MTGIFKAYDIRGRFPDELDELTARKTGFAFSRLMEGKNVVIGRDSRLSSPPLAEAFIEGYVAAGRINHRYRHDEHTPPLPHHHLREILRRRDGNRISSSPGT